MSASGSGPDNARRGQSHVQWLSGFLNYRKSRIVQLRQRQLFHRVQLSVQPCRHTLGMLETLNTLFSTNQFIDRQINTQRVALRYSATMPRVRSAARFVLPCLLYRMGQWNRSSLSLNPLLFTLDFLRQEALAVHAVADLHATATGSF
jgi:hypothetical protein